MQSSKKRVLSFDCQLTNVSARSFHLDGALEADRGIKQTPRNAGASR
jgi:hypothetical protein